MSVLRKVITVLVLTAILISLATPVLSKMTGATMRGGTVGATASPGAHGGTIGATASPGATKGVGMGGATASPGATTGGGMGGRR